MVAIPEDCMGSGMEPGEMEEMMSPDGNQKIYINGKEWYDVTNITCSGPIYTMEEARALSYWPYKAIVTGGEIKPPKKEK